MRVSAKLDEVRFVSQSLLALLTFVGIAMCLLFGQSAHAAAPAGQWWDANYGYRLQISIPVVGATTLASGYSLPITFDHATEVTATHSLANGNDVRVVRWTGTAWVEIDRIVDPLSSWNSNSTQIWFQTQANINGNTTDDNYYLYYGNSAAGAPPTNTDNIFLFYDNFDGTSIDTGTWGVTGTITVTGSTAALGNNERLRAKTADSFGTDTIWEARVKLSSGSSGFNFWGNSSGTAYTSGNYMLFQTTAAGLMGNTSGATAQTLPAGTLTNFQNYAFAREGSTAVRFWVNGAINSTPDASITSGIFTNAYRPSMRNDSGGGTMTYDYVRVREYRSVEPIATLGTPDNHLIAEWHFDELNWTGAANEILDTGPYGLDMRSYNGANTANATAAKTGNPGTCRYGTFNGTNQYAQAADNPVLDITDQLTVSVWVYPRAWPTGGADLKSILSKDTNYEFHLNPSGQVYWWWGGAPRDLTSSTSVPLNQWTHIAITYTSGAQRLYINGVLRGSNNQTGALSTNALPLQIGYDQDQPLRYWNGYIDEVEIYGKALTQAQVTDVMNATHPCAGATHLTIAHDGHGINCVAEPITVYPRDASNNNYLGYNETITLDTGSGKGDWSLLTGNGVLNNGVANDGIATYQWASTDLSAVFALSYKEGAASINISATSPTISDDNTEGNLVWSPSGFTVTSSALSNPPPGVIPAFASPQIAGTSFPVYLTAFGTTPTDSTCGVIEAYTGSKSLKFWSTYVNPTTGTRTVSINGGAIQTAEGTSASQAVTFVNGQASVTALYKDAGQLAIGMKDDTVGDPNLPNGIRGSTGNFVSRPSTFVLSNIKRTDNGVANLGATSATGAVFIPAGQAFSATVTALESGGTATPNFGKEIIPESVSLTSSLVLPSGGANPTVAASTGFGTFSSGVATGVDFSWAEVGILTFTPHIKDGDYLGIGDVVGTTSGNVGRFIPYNFSVTQNSPAMASSCGTNTGPDYLGQPLTYSTAPVLSLTALALGGAITKNYQGAFYKLTSSSSNSRTYVTSTGTLDQTGLPANDPTALSLLNGLATLTFNTNAGIFYVRSATPIAPFTPTLTLSLNILDSDGVAYSSSTSTLSSNPFTINTPSIATPEQRYGRIAFRNAVGSELINLPLPMHAEYFLSTTAGFVENTSDSCTTGVTTALTINLTGGTSCLLNTSSCTDVSGQAFQMPPLAGDFNAILKATGVGHTGTVKVTATVPTWLQYDWDTSTPGFENPTGFATFGIYQGESKRIFQIEK